MKRIVICTLTFFALALVLSFTSEQRRELVWSRVMADGTPNKYAGWDANGEPVELNGAGIGGTTGAVDNKVLRADGTGGVTLQPSAVSIDDFGNVSILGTDASLDTPPTLNARLRLGAANNSSTPHYPLLLWHDGLSTPGVGTGIQFAARTDDGDVVGAIVEAVTTDINAGSVDFDLVLSTMEGSAPPNGPGGEKLRITSTGRIIVAVLPTACTGEAPGTLWNDAGTLKVCP